MAKPGPKKGQLQKRTQDLLAKCQAFNIDIWEEMLKELISPQTDQPSRIALLKEMAQYLYPKRKAIEISQESDLRLAEQAKEFQALPKHEQALLLQAEAERLKREAKEEQKDVTPK